MRTAAITATVILMAACPCLAWTATGHNRATRIAIEGLSDTVPTFITEGVDAIAHASLTPDIFKRPVAPKTLDAIEAPDHYLDLELLRGKALPRSRQALVAHCVRNDITPSKMGFLPYAVTEWTQRLTVALAEHRRWPDNPHIQAKCLLFAGILAHYAEDLCMPLHTTIHYDGRARQDGSSPRSGIHRRVDKLPGMLPTKALPKLDAAQLKAFNDVFDEVVAELKRSHAQVDRVYELEQALPDRQTTLEPQSEIGRFTISRTAAASRFTARLILTAWKDSAHVDIPEWHLRPAGRDNAPADVDDQD